MSSIVKLYMETEGEIHLFHFNSPTPDYAEFEKRVRELAVSACANFRLFGKDTEGDLIVVGSDLGLEEVRNQQHFTKDKFLRIYLRPAKGPSETAQNKSIHAQVSGSGCKGEVARTRYKCLKCPNYDLCEKCMGNGTHCEHDMLAARSPQSQQLTKLLAQSPGSRDTPQPTYHSFAHSIGDAPVMVLSDGKSVVSDNSCNQQIHELIGNASKSIVDAIDSLKDQVERLAQVLGTEKTERMEALQAKELNKASPYHEKGEDSSARLDTEPVVAEKPQLGPNGQGSSPLLTEKEMYDGYAFLGMSFSGEYCALRDLCVKFNGDTSRVLHFLESMSHLKNLLRSYQFSCCA